MGTNVTQVLQDSGYYTPGQKEHIHNLLVPSGHQYWPGLPNVGCKCNIWLITLNGREEWFEDNRGSLVRMGQYGDECDHFSMMQPQWIGEVGVQVDKAMKAIVSSLWRESAFFFSRRLLYKYGGCKCLCFDSEVGHVHACSPSLGNNCRLHDIENLTLEVKDYINISFPLRSWVGETSLIAHIPLLFNLKLRIQSLGSLALEPKFGNTTRYFEEDCILRN